MRRVIRSFRTRKNIRHTSALRDQFLRELTREAEALMKQLSEQFSQTLQAQIVLLTQRNLPGGDTVSSTLDASSPGSVGSIGQLLSTGVRYLLSRPRTSRNAAESTRSRDMLADFRTSQAQQAAALQSMLERGEKNR